MSALQRLKRLHAQQKELQEGKEPNPKEQPLFHLKITHKVPPKNSFQTLPQKRIKLQRVPDSDTSAPQPFGEIWSRQTSFGIEYSSLDLYV